MTTNERDLDLRPYILAVLKKWWFILLLVIIAAVGAYLISIRKSETYKATNTILLTRTRSVLSLAEQFPTVTEDTYTRSRIDAILDASDAVMVARGDLGIEMPLSSVPGAQKQIVSKCLAASKPVITATQMLESMISNPRPTRAEASDVANAVLDGSDAVMLSGETAAGRFPVRVVQVMAEIVGAAEERYPFNAQDRLYQRGRDETITESVSETACRLAQSTGAVAIACLTATGTTARAIARHRPSVPIYAFTDDEAVVRRLSLLWGTKGFAIPFQHDTDRGVEMVHRVLTEAGVVRPNDRIVITAGMPLPRKGRTNMVHVSRVPS